MWEKQRMNSHQSDIKHRCPEKPVASHLIECIKCKKQYVGETENALHIQMNSHRLDIKHQCLEKPVASHFNSEGQTP